MTSKDPRKTKTPKQRAEEALGIAERRLKKLNADNLRLQREFDAVVVAVAEAKAYRDYCKNHPALAPATSTVTPTKEAGTRP